LPGAGAVHHIKSWNVVGKVLHFGPASLKHRDFHATLLIEVHVQRRLGKVVVLVEIACQALWQLARLVVVGEPPRTGAVR